MRKTTQGLMLVVAGLALQWSGFQPNVEQAEVTKTTILAIASPVPCVGFLLAFAIFSRYRLVGSLHHRIRSELDERASNRASS